MVVVTAAVRPEMTAAVTTCAECADTRALGALSAHLQAPGVVLRCASCSAVQVRLVRAEGRVWLDLRGVRTAGRPPPPS